MPKPEPTTRADPVQPLAGPRFGTRAVGEAFYDALMADIEPELLTGQLPLQQERYRDESPDAALARAGRYSAAFDEYDRRAAALLAAMDTGLATMRRTAQQSTEHDDRAREAAALADLARSIAGQ